MTEILGIMLMLGSVAGVLSGGISFSDPHAFGNFIAIIVMFPVGSMMVFGAERVIGFIEGVGVKRTAICVLGAIAVYYIAFTYYAKNDTAQAANSGRSPSSHSTSGYDTGYTGYNYSNYDVVPAVRSLNKEICTTCRGTGKRTCIVCSGTGRTLNRVPDAPNYGGGVTHPRRSTYERCTICHGTGEKICIVCAGAGYFLR